MEIYVPGKNRATGIKKMCFLEKIRMTIFIIIKAGDGYIWNFPLENIKSILLGK